MAPAATSSPTTPTTTKGRVLIVGGTGFIGKFVTEASLSTTHPTYLLVRPGPLLSSKAATIKAFQEKGAIVIYVSRSQYIIFYFLFI
jgi:leucoanthocyanidin reductase